MKLYTGGHLSFYMPGRKQSLELVIDAPKPLIEILAQIGIPLSELAITVINGDLVQAEAAVVHDGDQVRVFSAVDGG